ncbi:MAG TPA: mechanosensitive ion channel domain-containing protein [Phnomibacter sp.]|nr:mechanosensitive ion channel domain-containing protein [Phnomibacter sp.]
MKGKTIGWYLAILLVMATGFNSYGQNTGTRKSQKRVEDAASKARKDSLELVQKIDSARKEPRQKDTVTVDQLNKIEVYANQLSEMVAYFNRGIDTVEVLEEIRSIENQIELGKIGVGKSITDPNLRNLTANEILLVGVESELETWQKHVSAYNEELLHMRNLLDSIQQDPILRVVPQDKALAQQYLTRIVDLKRRYNPVDSMNKVAMVEVGLLQGRIVRNLLEVKDNLANIEQQVKKIRKNFFNRDAPPIWSSPELKDDTSVMGISMQKAWLVLKYYLRNSMGASIIVLLLFFVVFYFTRVMIRRLQSIHKEFVLENFAPHIKTSIVFSSLFVTSSAAQFMYSNIPMVVLQVLWFVMWISITILFWPDLNKQWKRIWIGFGLMYLWACYENLVLRSSPTERWSMLLASAAGIALCLHMMGVYKRGNNKAQYFTFFAWLFLIQESIGFLANVAGNYTLARSMVVSGFFNFIMGVIFFFGITLIKELIVISFEYFSRNKSVNSYVNLVELKERAEKFLPTLAWIFWAIIFAKNLNFYDIVIDTLAAFFNTERKLGNIDFTFGSVAIFFVTIWISTLIAQLVSFLLGGNKSQIASIQKTRFGSSILVLKLVIISLGLLVAFAASGIPLDKITIIIGALGVGIGFGLQNIVNNLVSGVVLAFEKPIEIGDQVEVGTFVGKVKEIGIRSSKLATFEGAEVIIPNGDLLNQHVVNWTLSNNHRRVEIIVGVKYGTNLKEAQTILQDILKANTAIDAHPTPLVLVHLLNQSSIDFRLLFWADIASWVELKSEIIVSIDEAFRKAGIEIPFPQQDIYIKQMPGGI